MKQTIKYVFFVLLFFMSLTKIDALETDVTITKEYIPDIYYNQVIDGVLHWSRCPIFKALGKVVYCIEPGVPIRNLTYTAYDGWNYTNYDVATWKKLELYNYYGYDYPGHQNQYYFMATQQLIWEALGVDEVYYTAQGYGGGSRIHMELMTGEINNLILSHNKKPSFNNVLLEGFKNDTFVLSDNNDELNKFTVHNSNEKEVTINNNTITVKTTNNNDEPVILSKNYSGKTIIYKSTNSQTLAKLEMTNQQVYATLNFKIVTAKVHLKFEETEEYLGDSTLYGALYEMYNNEGYRVPIQTDSEGKATVENLDKGTYFIRQLQPSKGYKRDGRLYRLVINGENLNNTVILDKNVIKSQIVINKFYQNDIIGICNKEKDISFAIYNKDNLIDTITTDEFGLATILLPYGTYLIKQLNTTPNYEKVPDFEVTIDERSEDVLNFDLYDKNVRERLSSVSVGDVEDNEQLVSNLIKFNIPKTTGENKGLYIILILIGAILIRKENRNEN